MSKNGRNGALPHINLLEKLYFMLHLNFNRAAVKNMVTAFCIIHLISSTAIAQLPASPDIVIGNHTAIYDSHGTLLPWTSWQDAITREMEWYLQCPITHG